MSDDALNSEVLMSMKRRLQDIAFPELKPDEYAIGYICKSCGRAQPLFRHCPHVGPDLMTQYGTERVKVAQDE